MHGISPFKQLFLVVIFGPQQKRTLRRLLMFHAERQALLLKDIKNYYPFLERMRLNGAERDEGRLLLDPEMKDCASKRALN
jgi:hypothetical protein